MYNVVCLKWGSKYPAEYVNRLHNMVRRNTTLPVNFYCITDDANDLNGEIHARMLPDLGIKGWWYKLMLFKSELFDITGTTIFLDLDVVITSNIDDLFTYKPGSFRIIKDLKQGYNSSVFRLDIGSHPDVWQDFWSNKDYIIKRLHGDQNWIEEAIPMHMNTWPKEWVVSFKKECDARATRTWGAIGRILLKFDLFPTPKGHAQYPNGTKIVIFHGKPDPIDVMNGPWGVWKEAPWIREYWK